MDEPILEAGQVELSVVVVTRNRVDRLKRCIDALLAVTTTHDWELIGVDNGSTDGTARYLSSLARNSGVPTMIALSAPIPGRCRGINLGWRAARSEIICVHGR
jgi:glycosyltransferase involved in cell wall biosynthesis